MYQVLRVAVLAVVAGLLVGPAVVAWFESPGSKTVAVVLTVEAAVVILLVGNGHLRIARVRARAAIDTPDELDAPPDPTLPPALVGILVAGRGRGDRSIVGGTVLDLADRGQVRIDGLDAVRFRVVVAPHARGEAPHEWYVIQNLRLGVADGADAVLEGPPLWGRQHWRPPKQHTFNRDVLQIARNRKLLAIPLLRLLLAGAPFVIGRTFMERPFPGWGWLVVAVFVLGPLLGFVAAGALDIERTAAGERARAQWLAYGQWLRANAELADVGVPAWLVWGRHLTYGCVLGCAPVTAEALAPRFARR